MITEKGAYEDIFKGPFNPVVLIESAKTINNAYSTFLCCHFFFLVNGYCFQFCVQLLRLIKLFCPLFLLSD